MQFVPFQKSFLLRLEKDKDSETFFKVFYDRVREAQAEIKATVSVNTSDSLTGKKVEDGSKDSPAKADQHDKGRYSGGLEI